MPGIRGDFVNPRTPQVVNSNAKYHAVAYSFATCCLFILSLSVGVVSPARPLLLPPQPSLAHLTLTLTLTLRCRPNPPCLTQRGVLRQLRLRHASGR